MKVLMFIASSLDGGAEKVVADLSNTLAAQGDEMVVAAFSNSLWLHRLTPQVRVRKLTSSEAWYDPRLYWQLCRLIRCGQPDIVHSHGAKASKIINRVARITPLLQVATKHNSRKGKIFNRLKRVTAVSQRVADSISHPSEMIYNGVQRRTDIQRATPQSAFSMLAVGRLDPIKRFHWLIREVAALPFDCSLEIVGEGPQRGELEALFAELGAEERVTLAGYQSDIPQRMAEKDLVVITSRSEGFSLVMVEALFYAKLFISTEVGAAPELLPETLLIKEGELGATLQLVQQNYIALANEFKRFSEEQAPRFEMDKVAAHYRRFYQSQLESEGA